MIPSAPCPLCLHRRGLTNEDIIPTWARDGLMRDWGPFPRGQAPRRLKIRICGVCNTRLARVFESPTAALIGPMVRGDSIRLSPRQQVLVASWIAKTSLLLTLFDLPRGTSNRELARRVIVDMMESGLPPSVTSVRLARVDMTDRPDDLDAAADDIAHLLPATLPQPAYYSVSTMGYLGWEMSMGPAHPYLRFIEQTPDNDRLIRIWPPRIPYATWPPPAILPPPEFLAVRQAWARIVPPEMLEAVRPHIWSGPSLDAD